MPRWRRRSGASGASAAPGRWSWRGSPGGGGWARRRGGGGWGWGWRPPPARGRRATGAGPGGDARPPPRRADQPEPETLEHKNALLAEICQRVGAVEQAGARRPAVSRLVSPEIAKVERTRDRYGCAGQGR